MAVATGFTAQRMLEIEQSSVVSGLVDSRGRLILETKRGDSIDAGSVQGVGPAGTVTMFAGTNAPEGYILCDGRAVPRSDFPVLFSIIGTTYGAGNGTTTFNVPNLKGRVVVGVDAGQTEFSSLALGGGEKSHTLTVDEMPNHTHVQNPHTHTQNSHTHTQSSHNHTQSSHNHTQNSHTHTQSVHTHAQVAHAHDIGVGVGGSGSAAQYRASGYQNSGASTTTGTFASSSLDALNSGASGTNQSETATNNSATALNTPTTASNNSATATNNSTTAVNQSTGNGQSHNNLQPFLTLNYIIKT